MSVSVVFCMMEQDRLASVQRNLGRVLPHVDLAVIVDNGSTDGTREWLATQPKVVTAFRQWDDSFVEGRNTYLRKVGELVQEGVLAEPVIVCIADDDELYSDDLCAGLKTIAEEMYLEDLNSLRIRSRSVETDWNGDVHWSHDDDWHKPLIMLWEEGLRYRGIGKTEVHEDIVFPSGRRERTLPDEGMRLCYDHVKKHGEIWPRAIRNAFAGGGGPNLGDLVPFWKPFKAMVKDLTGIETADRFVRYLQDTTVLPQPLADFFIAKRLIGTQWDPTPPLWPGWPDGTSEWREGWLSYYVYFHPERMPLDFVEKDLPYKDYRAAVRVIHGPNAPSWAQ